MLSPRNEFLIVEPDRPREPDGVVVPASASAPVSTGVVLAAGPGDVRKGDRVVFHPHSLQQIQIDGTLFHYLDRDLVIAVIDGRDNAAAIAA